MTPQEFQQWCDGVCGQLAAPPGGVNQETLTHWEAAEGGASHMNPLNTTWFMPGATIWNTLPSGAHVWTYASVNDAIIATVNTLLNGLYPTIVAHLRNSVPFTEWQDACPELEEWGTGCDWLPSKPPPVVTPKEKEVQTFKLAVGESVELGGYKEDSYFNFIADGQNGEIGVIQVIASKWDDGTYYALSVGPNGTISLESAKFGVNGPKQAAGQFSALGITGPFTL
jgi:hypothetical protein